MNASDTELEHKAGELLMVKTDLEEVAEAGSMHLDVEVAGEDRVRLTRISRTISSSGPGFARRLNSSGMTPIARLIPARINAARA